MKIRLRDQLDCRKQEDNESSLNLIAHSVNRTGHAIRWCNSPYPSRVQFKGAKTLRNARFKTRKYGRIQEPTQKIRRDNNTR
jgi:hypothetical protein